MARRALGPATLRAVQALAAAARDTAAPPRWLLGCSGGPDSLALAAAAVRVAAGRDDLRVGAVVVDHGLQPGSADAAARAADAVRAIGLTDVVVRAAGPGPADAGPEGAARTARYAVLEEEAAAREADLLLGHTLDDQAETVLLGLLRGSGPRSLAAMAPRAGRRLRPFLGGDAPGLRRADTEAVCAELGLDPWRDPHNADPRFRRVAVRERLLPALAALADAPPDALTDALVRTAALARDDADLLDELADGLARECRTTEPTGPAGLRCAPLGPAPRALRTRVLRRWLVEAGAPEPALVHVRAVEALVTDWRGQRFVEVPGLRVRRAGDRLLAVPAGAGPSGVGGPEPVS
ncbi:tRNA(Ile)-lysidine synthase [Friedmanniella endophytica]|uniref:tRNA(Ile)-lysidine synthase n=1 Tax=Microlunatus kandeliicorticis TaxID=1759536 RepID=A0A7W3P4C2_9ACTN|nr:tRNA lysidine(34) synthetase TilS [Microlunatus kandeliicorticis]MBA8792718.1 tRNA(Ile)-lysidine synthase [Microlunatus kandeliicorticis]